MAEQDEPSESDITSRPIKRLRTAIMRAPEPEFYSKPKIAYNPPANTLNFKSVFDPADSALDASSASVLLGRSSNKTSRLTIPDASAVSRKRKSALVRPMKPPVFATPPRPLPDLAKQQTTESTASIFRRIPPVASTSKAQPEFSKPKSLIPVPPPPSSHKPQPTLKALTAPPPPSKKGKEKDTSQAHLRTISTTHIALATDLTSQAGSASLLSIFLQGNKPDVDVIGEEKEIRRGIDVSPVKGGRKGRGFVRNGLAERASNLLSRSQTAFALWHKETSSLLSSTTSVVSRRSAADLHLCISKILYEPPHSRPAGATSPTIALCRVMKMGGGEELTDDIYPVLFCSRVPADTNNAAEGLEEGREVYIWKPWYTVELPERGIEMLGEALILLCSRFFVK